MDEQEETPPAPLDCGAGEPGHDHTLEGRRLMETGAVHVHGNTYRFGPPLPGHWDHPGEESGES